MKIIQKIMSNKFTKSIILISGGTALAQVLNALFSPIITRLYTPEEYGILTIYLSFLGIISIAGSLGYEYAIPISDNDEKAANIIALCFIILSSITIISVITIIVLGDTILHLFNSEFLDKYFLLLPLGIFSLGSYNIFHQWAFRKQNYKKISQTKIHQSITQNLSALIFGFLKFGPPGLILSRVIGQSSGVTTLGMDFIKKIPKFYKNFKWNTIGLIAKRYKKFPLYSAPSQVLNTVGTQLPIFFITSLYGTQILGYYGLANSIVNIPMILIGRSIADVFYAEASRIGRFDPQKLKTLSNSLLKKLMFLGSFPFLVLLFFGPLLFKIVFGAVWTQAGVFSQIIAFLVYMRLIFTPISNIFIVFEKQKEAFFLNALRVVLVLITFGLAIFFRINVNFTIFIYSIAMSFIYFITYIFAKNILEKAIKEKK